MKEHTISFRGEYPRVVSDTLNEWMDKGWTIKHDRNNVYRTSIGTYVSGYVVLEKPIIPNKL